MNKEVQSIHKTCEKGMWTLLNFRFYFLFFLLNSIVAEVSGGSLSVDVEAKGALLINASTGVVLYEKNADKLFYPASITKIATAIFAIELSPDGLSEEIAATWESIGAVTEEAKRQSNYTIPSHRLVRDACHMGIKAGEIFTLNDLLYGLMVVSADDAANVIAMAKGGSIPDFMDRLNDYLKKLGCKHTNFNNPHGLFHPKHVTTAYDMATLTRHALKNPVFRQIVSTARWVRPKTNKQASTVLVQTNKLLKKGKCYYPKAIGVKTGVLAKARNTLVAAAVDGDRTLIAVLLKSENRDQMFLDAIKLFEAAFNQPLVERLLINAGEFSYSYLPEGSSKPIKTSIGENVSIRFYPAEEPQINAALQWNDVKYPVEKGQCVGEITLKSADGQFLRIVPVLAAEDASPSWGQWIKSFW